MDLILWRHAQAQLRASEDAPVDPQRDLARPLTPKGLRQAERVAEWLNQRLPDTTRVLCSPALRAQQTAAALGRRVRIVEAIHPLADVQALLQAARWPASRDPVLIVGHQPTLGLLAARLICGEDQPWGVRKGAVWWLRSREREAQPGEHEAALHAVISPDMV